MTDIKISALPAAATPTEVDEIPLVQAGVTKKATVGQISSAAPVASVDGRIGDVTLTDRYVQLTGGGITGSLTVSNFIAVGTNPATTGIVRLPNNQIVMARNAANTADIRLMYVGLDNGTYLGDAGSSTLYVRNPAVAIGTNPASTGILRLPNNQAIYSRNTTNVSDIQLLGLDSNGIINIGAVGINAYLHGTVAIAEASGRLGFFGASPGLRPTGTPAAATDPASTMALVNDLRAKLIALGLIS